MSSVFAGQSRDELRRGWVEAWRKGRARALLTPLESALVGIVDEHPEYHDWLERGDVAIAKDFTPEHGAVNPFLHLSMHLALREQVGTNRPTGIAAAHARLGARLGPHEAEHAMMEALGRALWEAQRAGVAPDERSYLEDIERLASRR